MSVRIYCWRRAHAGPVNDCARLPPMIDRAHAVAPLKLVLADAEFNTERNHQHLRQKIGVDGHSRQTRPARAEDAKRHA